MAKTSPPRSISVAEDHEPVVITRDKGKPAAVLISLEDFASHEETSYLLRSPRNAERLRKAIEEFDPGRPMDQASVNRMICSVRWANAILQFLHSEKENPSITLGELHQRFVSQYEIDPSAKDFAFYNQHQFLTSLLAYLCRPAEKFFDVLPELSVNLPPPGWGTQGPFFRHPAGFGTALAQFSLSRACFRNARVDFRVSKSYIRCRFQ